MIGRIALAAICLLSTGCTIPLFEHPLESPHAATIPPRLCGTYKQVGGPDNVAHHVHVGPAGAEAPAGVFRFVSVSQPLDKATPLKATRGYGIATRMGDFYVLQIPVYSAAGHGDGLPLDRAFDRETWDDSAILGYLFARVRVAADCIEMSYVNGHFVESAIEDGELCGNVERTVKTHTVALPNEDGEVTNTTVREDETEAITVTAEPCSLRSFVHANIESGLFSETVTTFTRND